MNSLINIALKAEDPVRPFGEPDVLLFYGAIAPYVSKYLHGKMIATKTWLPSGRVPFFLRRGSKDPPLYIEDMVKAITPELIEKRHSIPDLKSARREIDDTQELVWSYFVPRKLVDLFYATNGEGEGKPVKRIFFDIDRGEGVKPEDSLEAAKLLVENMMADDTVMKMADGKPFVSWTGASFHVFLELKEAIPAEEYGRLFEVSTVRSSGTNAEKWVAGIKSGVKSKVAAGHDRVKGAVTIDPSQTPSGKLCRVPLGALHMKDAKTIDGVSVPLTLDMLEKDILGELTSYTPKKLLEELPSLARRLPA